MDLVLLLYSFVLILSVLVRADYVGQSVSGEVDHGNYTYYTLREDFNKKNSKKSDIVTIRSGTYLPYLNSDIKISDICLKTLYLPTYHKEIVTQFS